MEKNCKSCKKFFECYSKFKNHHGILPKFPSMPCQEFDFAKKHAFVVIHFSCLSRKFFIIGFADSYDECHKIEVAHSRYGSKNHKFYICDNTILSSAFNLINDIKDYNLLSICENVAFALSRGEYHMLKHRYTKSKSCIDLAKKHIANACYLLENY